MLRSLLKLIRAYIEKIMNRSDKVREVETQCYYGNEELGKNGLENGVRRSDKESPINLPDTQAQVAS